MKNRCLVFALCFLPLSMAVTADDGIMVNVRLPDCPWADSRLEIELARRLSTIRNVPVTWVDSSVRSWYDNHPKATFDDLVAVGKRLGGRYLVDILIDRIDLEKRKVTVIPLTVFRYRVFGVLTGTMRIIDVEKNRLVGLKEICYEVKASDQWQFTEDDPTDPTLLIPPDRRYLLFQRLDRKAAAELFKEIRKLSRGAYRGR
ncbi:MAG: hypothetical protein JSV44_01605 [Candidatus Zixiibacteriota bacterium]|nr:MAG: hypothetical protein JSV44_01605 [candidate division Zixibacteria bacterium]